MYRQLAIYFLVTFIYALFANCFGFENIRAFTISLLNVFGGMNLVFNYIKQQIEREDWIRRKVISMNVSILTCVFFLSQNEPVIVKNYRMLLTVIMLSIFFTSFFFQKFTQENIILFLNLLAIGIFIFESNLTDNYYGYWGGILLGLFEILDGAEIEFLKRVNMVPFLKNLALYFLFESIYPNQLSQCSLMNVFKDYGKKSIFDAR